MDSYILCGMQFGEEEIGTFVDFLAFVKNADCIVKYNGGSQSSHVVTTPEGMVYKFSQLGAGMFSSDICYTYITENVIVNLENLASEIEEFSKKTGISISNLYDRIYIHENCLIVTPYHKLLNRLRELSQGINRRGSDGTGVDEVKSLIGDIARETHYNIPLGIQVKHIYWQHSNNTLVSRLGQLQEYVQDFYNSNKETIWKNTPNELKEELKEEIDNLLKANAFFDVARYYRNLSFFPKEVDTRKCIYNSYENTLRKNNKVAIFEGTQGLLLDMKYGIKPNTTCLDTTINYALDISMYRDKIKKIGIVNAFMSRRGVGIFPTESKEVSDKIDSEEKNESFWSGKTRFGWFDAVLVRYAQKINHVDELYLSSLDKLDGFSVIKVCDSYSYKGKIDRLFKKIFDYCVLEDGTVLIKNIKENNQKLGYYLELCKPVYYKIDGWRRRTSRISTKGRLPRTLIEYILTIEECTGIPVRVISVGETRNQKLVLAENDSWIKWKKW